MRQGVRRVIGSGILFGLLWLFCLAIAITFNKDEPVAVILVSATAGAVTPLLFALGVWLITVENKK